MSEIFPEPISKLPKADIPIEGLTAYLVQGESFQILFMRFENDAILPEHSHESQWGIVLEGKIELTIEGKIHIYKKGDRYFIPKGVKHSGKIYAGYADMTYFNEKDRYKQKQI
ncbi:MAG: cupin domain-containing protein [Asgard group archaeon]|nr:cupin domain-containing protein [Asgard group archaeon]